MSGPYSESATIYDVLVGSVSATPTANKDGDIQLTFDEDGTPRTVEIQAPISTEPGGNNGDQWVRVRGGPDGDIDFSHGSATIHFAPRDFDNQSEYLLTVQGTNDNNGIAVSNIASFKVVRGCGDCPEGIGGTGSSCTAGSSSASNHCIDLTFNLGKGQGGRGIPGTLHLHALAKTTDIFDPSALELRVDDRFEVIGDPDLSGGSYLKVFQGFGQTEPNATAPESDAPALQHAAPLTYTVDGMSAGTYSLWMRTRASGPPSDSLWMTLDGAAAAVAVHATASESWQWSRVTAPLPLAAGTRTFRFFFRDPGLQVDRLLLTDDATFTPEAEDDVPATGAYHVLEAEAATRVVPPFVPLPDATLASGAYIDTVAEPLSNELGSGAYTLTLPGLAAGDYQVWTKVTAPDSHSDSVYLSLQGGASVLWQWTPSATAHWERAPTQLTQPTPGDATLKLICRETGFLLDAFLASARDPGHTTGAGHIALDAEAGVRGGDAAVEITGDPLSESNGAYLTGGTGTADLPFTVSPGHAGAYRLLVRARTGPTAPRVSVDVGTGGSVSWDLPVLPVWSWVELGGTPVSLPEGAQVLSLDFQSGDLELDRVVLTRDAGFSPAGLEREQVVVEAESGHAAPPFVLRPGVGVEVAEASLRNTEKALAGFARMSLPDTLPAVRHQLWVRAPLSLSAPSSLWVNAHREDEAWTLAYDPATHGAQPADLNWIWHRCPVAVNAPDTSRVLLKWRERGTRLDALLLTDDPLFNPNDSELGALATHPAVRLYQEAEQAGQFDAPWRSYRPVRQILSGTALLDIRPRPDTRGYTLDFYPVPAVPTLVDGLYALPDPSQRRVGYEIHDPAGEGARLDIRRDGTARYSFLWNDAALDWKLIRAGGLSVEDAQTVWNADRTLETRTMTIGPDANQDERIDLPTSRTVEVYRHKAGRRFLLSRTVDPDGEARTTTYTYTPDPLPGSGAAPGDLLQSVRRPNGYWEIHAYDEHGEKTKTLSQYANSAFGDEANSRVVHYAHEIPAEVSATLPQVTDYQRRVTTVLGVETGRSYTLTQKTGNAGEATFWTITATRAGAAWNAEGNRVTVRERLANYRTAGSKSGWMTGTGAGLTVEQLTRYAYEENTTDVWGEPAFKTTRTRGLPNAGATAVIEGRKTETWTRYAGPVETRRNTYAILAAGVEELIDSSVATNVDAFHRVLETTTYDPDGTPATQTSTTYTCCGIASRTDASGIPTTYRYDGMDRRVSTTRLGVTTETLYDASSRVLATRRYPEGSPQAALTLSSRVYGLDGDLESESVLIASDTGATATTTTATTILTGTDSLGDPVGLGERRVVTSPDGGTTITETTADGLTLRSYGSAGNARRMTYTKQGTALVRRTIPLVYDALAADPSGFAHYTDAPDWVETHTHMGRILRMAYADGSASDTHYDLRGRLVKTIDPDGVTTLHAYNARGERYRTAIDLDRDGSLDPAVDRVSETDRGYAVRGGQTVARTTNAVWSQGSLVLTGISDQSLNGRERWTESFGQIRHTVSTVPVNGGWTVTATQPDGRYAVQTYTNGRLSGTVDYDAGGAQLASTTILYDALGRQELVTDARTGTTRYHYYDNDALASMRTPDPDGTGPLAAPETRYEYDVMGRPVQTTLPDASTVHTTYNLKGQVVKTWGSRQTPVERTYDYAGRPRTLTTWQAFNPATGTGISGSATTTWIYDARRGWLSRKQDADGNGTDYTYTPGGRLASRTWARGLTTNYAYTLAGDLLAVDYQDAGATPDLLYAYHPTGFRTRAAEGAFAAGAIRAGAFLGTSPGLSSEDRATDFAQDPATLRLLTETTTGLLPTPAVLTRGYEDGSQPGQVEGRAAGYTLSTDGGGTADAQSTYGYDAAGRLHTVSDGTDTFTYGYVANAPNLLASVTGPVHSVAYTYEPGRNLMSAVENTETVGTSTLVSRYAYTHNELGQRVERTQSGSAPVGSTDTFSYDDLGQLTGATNSVQTAAAWDPLYQYDDIGNRTGTISDLNGSVNYTPDLLNQYDAIGTDSPTYDLDGNLITQGGWTYTWNGENRLIGATDGVDTLSFEYDHQGRLIREGRNGVVTLYLYDGWNRIASYVSTGARTSYLWGLDLSLSNDGVSGSMQGAGGVGGLLREGTLYPLYDANGNILQKLDAAGATVMNVVYDPFGNVISGSLAGDYGFSTKPLVEDLGFYYYGFRFFDPETGRWPSRDPIGERGGPNLYVFVGNDGVNSWDYLGMLTIEEYLTLYDALTTAIGQCDGVCDEATNTLQKILDKNLVNSNGKLDDFFEIAKAFSDATKYISRSTDGSVDVAKFIDMVANGQYSDFQTDISINTFQNYLNGITSVASVSGSLLNIASSDDPMIALLRIGQSFGPEGTGDLLSFYEKGYTKAKEKIEALVFSNTNLQKIVMAGNFCASSPPLCCMADAAAGAAYGE